MSENDVVAVIGGGPAGLAAAATLKPKGVRVRVLEKAETVGARWRGHYDRLHLHTTRRMSALPGLDIPSEYGRWVSRDNFVKYQEQYAQHHGIELETGTSVERVERAGAGYRVTTSKGTFDAANVIVAAGYNNIPYIPAWPGRESFTTPLVHSNQYKNGSAYAGKTVVVVGTGNSGAEIATDLAEHGAEVLWSFRTAPTILPRAILGIAAQTFGIMLRPLSPSIVDPVMAAFGRITIGNLKKFGLPRPTRGGYTGVLQDHVLPILDVGLVGQIKKGRIRPMPMIAALEGDAVVFADGQRASPAAVIACTGFRPALEPIVGHLGVLAADGTPLVHGTAQHTNAPGLFFLGYTNALSGNLREIAVHARQVANTIAMGRQGALKTAA